MTFHEAIIICYSIPFCGGVLLPRILCQYLSHTANQEICNRNFVGQYTVQLVYTTISWGGVLVYITRARG